MTPQSSRCSTVWNGPFATSGEDRIRTLAENTAKNMVPDQSGAESGAPGAQSPSVDADLRAIIDRWPDLSDEVKAGIMVMTRATANKG